jgi:hypothetical protein
MPALLAVGSSSPIQIYEFEDAGRAYAIRYSWVERLGAYYLDILDGDTGDELFVGRRLSPGGLIARLPSGGTLSGLGVLDPYAYEALGVTLYVALTFAEDA